MKEKCLRATDLQDSCVNTRSASLEAQHWFRESKTEQRDQLLLGCLEVISKIWRPQLRWPHSVVRIRIRSSTLKVTAVADALADVVTDQACPLRWIA